MSKNTIQRIVFIICVVLAFFNPMLKEIEFIKFILLAGSLYYLFLGWDLHLIREKTDYAEHGIVGFIYSTVFFANFFDSFSMPLSRYLLYFCYSISLLFMIYIIVKRKEAKRDMLIQSVILWLVAPIPMWI